MLLAVCDDEKIELEKIVAMIRTHYAHKCEIKRYGDAESLLADSQNLIFDAIFLDIDMPGMNGMHLAEHIRTVNEYVKILFVTNREDCVFSGYKYGAFRFVRKSMIEQELPEALRDLARILDAKKEYITLKTPSGEVTRYIDKIQYFEVYGHELTVKCDDGVDRISGTMGQYIKLLSPKGFIHVHRSFLVNYRFIYSVEQTEIVLTDGKSIPLSRNRAKETKTKLQIFTRSFEDR